MNEALQERSDVSLRNRPVPLLKKCVPDALLGCLTLLRLTPANAPEPNVPEVKLSVTGENSNVLTLSPTGKVNEPAAVNFLRNCPVPVAIIILEADGVPLIVALDFDCTIKVLPES